MVRVMAETDGIARFSRLRARGLSRHDIDDCVRAGVISRVRRGWFALPGADRMLVNAARAGVVVSCLTQAKRLGLWVHEEPMTPHVGATPGSTGGKPKGVHVHWAQPVVPRHPDALIDPIENVLALVAACEPFEQALATWESALNKGLVTREALHGYSWKPAARRILAEAHPFSDAGLETYLRPRLRWLRQPLFFQIWIAGHRVDALIGSRLVLQIDGATHVGAQRAQDIRHDAQLRLMGYHVIRVGYHHMMHEWHAVQDLIMRAVAQGLHRAA